MITRLKTSTGGSLGPGSFRVWLTALLFSLASTAGSAEGWPVREAQGLDNPVLALNLGGGIGPTGSSPRFLDVMLHSQPWIAAQGGAWSSMNFGELRAGGYIDENGWVTAMPEGMDVIKVVWPGGLPAGRYILTYEGEGRFQAGGGIRLGRNEPGRLVVDFDGGNRNVWLNIVATDPMQTGNYLRNMTLVREDLVDLHQAGALFNPDWIALIADARQVRFMDWMLTNNATNLQTWEKRARPDGLRTGRGVPLEYMVRLANELGADPWFTMPPNASEDYIEGFARTVRDTLDPRLTVRVEYGNENWNAGFRHYHWLQRQAEAEWGAPVGPEYGVKLAVRNARIWDEVYGEDQDRVVHVLGVQTANTWLTGQLLTVPTWRQKEPDEWVEPASVFDELAITTYFGGITTRDPERRAAFLEILQTAPETAPAYLVEQLLDPDGHRALAWIVKRWNEQAEFARDYGLDLVAYEGGQHVHHAFQVRGMDQEEVQTLTRFMIGFVRSEDMARLYEIQIEIWKELGQGPYMHFNDVGAPSKWGSWGLYADLTDSTPRSAIVEALNATNDPWWDAEAGPHYQHGVTEFGSEAGDELVGTVEEDYLIGRAGDDVFTPGGGNDGIHGGPGDDVVMLSGSLSDYEMRAEGLGVRVIGPDGSNLLVAVERVADHSGTEAQLADLVQGDG